YYNIPFPTSERLEEIGLARLPEFVQAAGKSSLLKDAIEFVLFTRREEGGLEKKPGTAELLNWLSAMAALGASSSSHMRDQSDIARRCLPALAKISGDQERVQEFLSSWKDSQAFG